MTVRVASSTTGPVPARRIRLVATDLDGTLLRSDGTVSARTAAVLARLEAAGIALVLVTARPPRWMAPIASMTGHHGVAICANGAILYDLRSERVVECRPLDEATVRELVRRLRAAVPGGRFAVERLDGFACEPGHMQHQWDEESNPPSGDVLDLLTAPVVKLLFGHPELSADEMLARVTGVVRGLAEVTHSNPERAAVELSAAGVTKAAALARLCAARGIPAAEVLAFGDMPNDLPMLRWAGSAAAVANGHPDVLAAVTVRAASNDEDGVALALERLLEEHSAVR